MIAYVTLGTNDLARGAAVHHAIAKELAVDWIMEDERSVAWGAPGERQGAMRFYAGYFRNLDGNKLSAFTMSVV